MAATIELGCALGETRTFTGTHTASATNFTAVDISGWTIVVTLKTAALVPVTVTISASVTNGTSGLYTWTLSAANTFILDQGDCQIDIWRTDVGAETLMALGIFSITKDVRLPVGGTHQTITGPSAFSSWVITLPTSPSLPGSVLQPSDFHYLGSVTLPLDIDGQTRFGYSTGAFSGRVVGSDIRFFITGANSETGWNDTLFEVLYNGIGTRCTLLQSWGDVAPYDTKRISATSNKKNLRCLYWDPSTNQLNWSYMDAYSSNWDPCFGTSTLTGGFGVPGVVTAYGPWRPGQRSQFVGGFMYPLPASIQAILGGGKNLASGAPYSSIDSGSTFGPFGSAWKMPPNGTAPDAAFDGTHITIPTTDLLYTDINHQKSRIGDVDYCGWTHYGEIDGFGDQPQLNPTQNGTGCTPHGNLCGAPYGQPPTGPFGPSTNWLPGDTTGCAWWIDGPNKQGVVYFGQIARTMTAHAAEYGSYGRCHVWYGPAQNYPIHYCSHGQADIRYAIGTGNAMTTAQYTMWIYDPADIAAVAAGSKSPIGLVPPTDGYDMSQLPNSGVPFPQTASAWNFPWGSSLGGCWFEPVSKLLFVTDIHAEFSGEWRPIIQVFQVNC